MVHKTELPRSPRKQRNCHRRQLPYNTGIVKRVTGANFSGHTAAPALNVVYFCKFRLVCNPSYLCIISDGYTASQQLSPSNDDTSPRLRHLDKTRPAQTADVLCDDTRVFWVKPLLGLKIGRIFHEGDGLWAVQSKTEMCRVSSYARVLLTYSPSLMPTEIILAPWFRHFEFCCRSSDLVKPKASDNT